MSNAEEAEQSYEDLKDLLKLTPKKDVLFIIGDLNAKVGSQETPGVTGKLGLGVQNEAGQKLIVLPREHTGHSKHSLPTREYSTHGNHQMVNNKIRPIILFAGKDGEALCIEFAYFCCSQQKQDQELTVAQFMNSLLSNSI